MVKGKQLNLAEINFLCIHKKLRSKRLAPMLIREITRRVNLRGVWQAAYTAGVVLPKPIAQARYWHRSLNVKKLVDIGFTHLHSRMAGRCAFHHVIIVRQHQMTTV
jgi:glycylpeptide N-tetradecanoyltransferase